MYKEVSILAQNGDCVLQLSDVSKSFALVNVLKNITFSLRRGIILGLVGENGAGKSTMVNILGGIYQRDGGEILLDGQPFEPGDPKRSQAAGIAFIHQELNLFTNLTVAENLFIQGMPRSGPLHTVDYRRMRLTAKEKLMQLGIDDLDPDTVVGTLAMGQRQLVEITKAIIHEARIIILDEPTTSLSNKEKEKLFKIMHDLRDHGKSIIFISHILEDVFAHCDEIAVLRDGEIITQADTASLTRHDVIRMMVGRELNKIYPTIEKQIGEVVFEAKGIAQGSRFQGVDVSLREGEIVGMFGLMGAGRTELLRCLFGVDSMDGGEIVFRGAKIFPVTPESCIKNNMAFITENRREEGLLLSKTVKDNTVLANLEELGHRWFGFLDFAAEQTQVRQTVKKLNIKTFDPSTQAIINLSGGNQQKVVFGKWVLRKPSVFLLDEPTRGVDVGAKYEIYSIINDLAKNQSTILMVSSEMEELMGMCDRIIVMSHGQITAEFCKGDYDQERIMMAAIGGTIQ